MIEFTFLFFIDDLRGNVISRLSAPSNATGPLTTRLSVALEVKHILAFLVMAVMVVVEWTGKFPVIVVILCYLVNASEYERRHYV